MALAALHSEAHAASARGRSTPDAALQACGQSQAAQAAVRTHLALQQQEQQVLGFAEGAAQRAASANVHLSQRDSGGCGTNKGVQARVMPCQACPIIGDAMRAAMPCHTMPCHATSCHATPCHAMPCNPCCRHAMPCHSIPQTASPPVPYNRRTWYCCCLTLSAAGLVRLQGCSMEMQVS